MKAFLLIAAVSAISLNEPTQTKFSINGEPLHGTVGWDDINMVPTQKEENGARSIAAEDDDFMNCTFKKYANKQGLFSRYDALGAANEIIGTWKHLSNMQVNDYMANGKFDKAYDQFDPNGNGLIAFGEMYRLIKILYKE